MRSSTSKESRKQVDTSQHDAAPFAAAGPNVEQLLSRLAAHLEPGSKLIAVQDDRLAPLLRRGEVIAVQPDIEPWPGDIVIARDRSSGALFGGTYVQSGHVQSEYVIKSANPDRYMDADHTVASVVAVVIGKISGRKGFAPF